MQQQIRFLTSIKQYHCPGTGSDNLQEIFAASDWSDQGILASDWLVSSHDQLDTPHGGIYYFIGATGASGGLVAKKKTNVYQRNIIFIG